MNRSSFYAVTAIIFLAALSRILPHPPNVAPIAAMALFGGAYAVNRTLAFVIPLAALLVSNIFLGDQAGTPVVYVSMVAITCLGLLLRERVSPLRVLLATLGGSVLFFLVTNFVWLHNADQLYAYSYEGMVESYVAALPFFRNTLLGDLFYSGLLFSGYAWLKRSVPALRA